MPCPKRPFKTEGLFKLCLLNGIRVCSEKIIIIIPCQSTLVGLCCWLAYGKALKVENMFLEEANSTLPFAKSRNSLEVLGPVRCGSLHTGHRLPEKKAGYVDSEACTDLVVVAPVRWHTGRMPPAPIY